MENWIVFILVNIVLAYIVGVFGDLSAPSIKKYFSKQKLTIRERRIKKLKEDYEYIVRLREQPDELSFNAFRFIFSGLKNVVYLIFAIGVNISIIMYYIERDTSGDWFLATLVTIFLWLFNSLKSFSDFSNILKKMDGDSFQTYKEKTIKKLEKLGATLDDLEEEPNE